MFAFQPYVNVMSFFFLGTLIYANKVVTFGVRQTLMKNSMKGM